MYKTQRQIHLWFYLLFNVTGVKVWKSNFGSTNMALLHTEVHNLVCADLLMNHDRTPKIRSVWPTLGSKSPAEQSGCE